METTSDRLSTDEIISAVAQLCLPEIEEVFERILALQAERKAAHLSREESTLLFFRINSGLPADLRERLATLRSKREDETITDAEYEELTRLTDQVEERHADRLEALSEFAKLRGVTLPALLEEFGIRFPDERDLHLP